MIDALNAALQLPPAKLFSKLPPKRVGEVDRQYLNEVLDAGFRNTVDPANIFQRLESTFAPKVWRWLRDSAQLRHRHHALLPPSRRSRPRR